MIIKKVENLDLIVEVHNKIYLNLFPMESLKAKKEKKYNLINYEFWLDNTIIGYCIILDKEKEKTLHAWVGGILPAYQGNGFFSKFYDWLIEEGKRKKYKHITGNTDNYKFNIIRMMIKKGFYILSTGKGNYGDGVKIYLRYDIYEERKIRLSLTPNCNLNCFFCHHEGIENEKSNKLTIPEIERILSQARRLLISEITLTGGEPTLEIEKIIFILKYCSAWDKPPIIKIVTNGILLNEEIIEKLNYKGKLKINLSLHSIDKNKNIIGKDILLENYEKLINNLLNKKIPVRINSTILKGINSSSNNIMNLLKFALKVGVKKINIMELLVTKEQKQLYPYYLSNDKIEKSLKEALSNLGKYRLLSRDEKKVKYKIFINENELEISIYRLSCRIGCKSCKYQNDITISSEAKGHPCYLEPNISIGNALESLESLIKQCDESNMNKYDNFSKKLLYWGEEYD